MIYIVFALIVAAAAIYLYLTESRHVTQIPLAGVRTRAQLEERQQVIRASLKDLAYEQSIGKMDKANYQRLESELLTEWEKNEQSIAALPKESAPAVAKPNTCPSCNAVIPISGAKFCPSCGGKLAQWLMAFTVGFIALLPNDLSALDIRATVKNGTTNTVHTAPLQVQLLRLEQGMQQVAAKPTTAGSVTFTDLPAPKAGPYMVQTVYAGVTYSRVIPPNMPEPIDVPLEIYESTTSTAKMHVRTLVELRRVDKNVLAGLMILFFINTDNRTFTAGKDGLSFYLPAAAVVDQASISVGSGASNIQWLKLTAQKAGAGLYSVGQNVKPGERILQVMFHMPYDEKSTTVQLRSLYPQDTGVQLIAEPEDIQVRQGDKVLSRVMDKNLGRGLISFSPRDEQLLLTLVGGGIAQMKQTQEAEIEIKSPLQLWQKLLFPVAALILFAIVAWHRGRRNSFV